MWELEELREVVKKLERELERKRKRKAFLSERKGYTVRYVKCGKSSCKVCSQGVGHGPYVYRSERRGNRVVSLYLGKFEKLEDKLKSNLNELRALEEEIAKIEDKLDFIRQQISEILKSLD